MLIFPPAKRTAQMRTLHTIVLITALAIGGCAKSAEDGGAAQGAADAPSGDALTPEQLEHGIGPVSAFEPGPIDDAMAAAGMELYKIKCSACHKVDERYIGPALGDITTRRSPAFIMNMMLNPVEMTQKHPEGKKLLEEYVAPMADQSLSREDARAILEYLRTAAP